MSLITTLQYWTETYWDEHGDPRIKSLPLMNSLRPLAAILTLYSAFVLINGPLFMRNRTAFSLKRLLIVYNLLMSALNGYFFIRFLVLYDFGLGIFNVARPAFELSSDLIAERIHLSYIYELSKLVDLLDTVFFILRKKNNQVTGLHFYHHLTVPIIGWLYLRLSGDNIVLVQFGIMNSLIHTIMYAYYGLAAFGPAMQPYLWWKRYITQIQIIQFFIMFGYTVYFAVFQIGYHPIYMINQFIQSTLYIYLFSKFYFDTYNKGKGKEKKN